MAEDKETKSFSIKWILWPAILGMIIAISGIIGQSYDYENNEREINTRPQRHLSGIFKLPADGTIVDRDINGKELWYNKDERVHFRQLIKPPVKFTVVNRKTAHPTWTTDRKSVTSGRNEYSDKVMLKAAEGKTVQVKVKIVP